MVAPATAASAPCTTAARTTASSCAPQFNFDLGNAGWNGERLIAAGKGVRE